MNTRTDTFTIEHSAPGLRFDTFLRQHYPAVSRGALQRLIEQGHIRVNDHSVKPTHFPRAGEVVSVTWPEARPAEALPEDIPLNILHEDEDLLVLNKAPGMVVHPAAGNEDHTLVNALLHHCSGKLSGIGGVARPGIVHRLDKDTSGCLVVAKNDVAHLGLSEQFAGRTVRKVYHAIVGGEVPRVAGEIRAAIARHPTHRKRMAVTDEGEGRDAWTSYRVLQRFPGATLVEAIIHTGRTHQIRVHFQHLGYPVLGDETYGKRKLIRCEEALAIEVPRVMLHAHLLEFIHPRTGEKLTCTAPWPEDFQQVLKALDKKK
ncbi:MAG: RluA family pseudouridine synthase [Verrucomicrobiota bacterium]